MMGIESDHKPNREYKASLFASLFGEPDKMIELYNALTDSHYPADTRIEVATLSDVLFMDRINDLAFVVDGKLVILIEHQSTVNENMPLRLLIYLGRVYEMIVSNENLYRRKLVKIPIPEFIVVYNGDRDLQERSLLKLSDAFHIPQDRYGGIPLELIVTVYNVGKGHNRALVSRSDTLAGYVTLIDKIKGFISVGIGRSEAFTKAVRECIDEGVLCNYLEKNGSEVMNMLTQEWDMNKAIEVSFEEGYETGETKGIEKGIAQGLEKGIAQGLEKGIAQGLEKGIAQGLEKGIAQGLEKGIDQQNRKIARMMLDNGYKIEDISKVTGLPDIAIDMLMTD